MLYSYYKSFWNIKTDEIIYTWLFAGIAGMTAVGKFSRPIIDGSLSLKSLSSFAVRCHLNPGWLIKSIPNFGAEL